MSVCIIRSSKTHATCRSSLKPAAAWREALPLLHLNMVYGALAYLDAPNHERDFASGWDVWPLLDEYWRALRSDPDFDVYGALDEVSAEVQAIFDELGSFEHNNYSDDPAVCAG